MFVLITALAVAVAAVIGLAAATGVAVKKSNDSDAKLNALRESYAAVSDAAAATAATVTVTSTAPASTDVDQEELTSGCSNKKDTTTGTVYTSKCKLHQAAELQKDHLTIHSHEKGPIHLLLQHQRPQRSHLLSLCHQPKRMHRSLQRLEQLQHDPTNLRRRLVCAVLGENRKRCHQQRTW